MLFIVPHAASRFCPAPSILSNMKLPNIFFFLNEVPFMGHLKRVFLLALKLSSCHLYCLKRGFSNGLLKPPIGSWNCCDFLSISDAEGSAECKLLKRHRGRKSALGVIKSAAVWLRRLQFKCVMCWVNDAAASGTLPPPVLELAMLKGTRF